ncbi:MAG: YihY/virulence factor BrkB family protein [Burkholderiaceae bacterium]
MSKHAALLATLRAVAGKLADDELPGRAAQMAFYFFLSLFPTLVILMAAAHTFADAQWLVRNAVLWRLDTIAPGQAANFFKPLLDHLAQRPGVSLFWAPVALWAASSGMAATIRGLNAAYGIDERRGWWRTRLIGLALTFGLLLLTTLAMLVLAYGDPIVRSIAEQRGWNDGVVLAWRIGHWPVAAALVVLAFDLLYHYGPHRPHRRWRWLSAGTLLALGLWLVASIGLDFYVSNVRDYRSAYGPIGTVVVLMLWLYLTGIAILAGAEINARIEQADEQP